MELINKQIIIIYYTILVHEKSWNFQNLVIENQEFKLVLRNDSTV